MSIQAVRAALETALDAMSPALATAWPNVQFTPVQGTPYQRADLLLAQPDNSEFGPNFNEQGVFHIALAYPTGAGPAAADARAELLRTTFFRGATFINGSVRVLVTKTPEVTPGQVAEDRWVVPVRITFTASSPA